MHWHKITQTQESTRVSHLAAELLLELPDEPDVDLPEGLAQAVGHMDHHGLPVPDHVHLAAKTHHTIARASDAAPANHAEERRRDAKANGVGELTSRC